MCNGVLFCWQGLQDELVVPFSGEGSYFSPLFLDPNDILVKVVPQMPAQSTFIDKTWLLFVHELNLALRCVNMDCLNRSLPPVRSVCHFFGRVCVCVCTTACAWALHYYTTHRPVASAFAVNSFRTGVCLCVSVF